MWLVAWMLFHCSVYICAKYDLMLYMKYCKVLNINNVNKI